MREMKPSGVDWIGEIPSSWQVAPLKYGASCSSDLSTYTADDSKEFLALENVESWTGRLVGLDERHDSVDSSVSVFSETDVLFGKLRPYLAKVCRPDFRGVCSTELLCISPMNYCRDYLFWLLISKGFIDVINAESYGVKMPRTSWAQMGAHYCPVPPLSEQQAIAGHLDAETAKIDQAMSLLRRELETLEQFKKSVIHKAVTKGPDPTVPMKPSGVEWIGGIPDHWRTTRIKYIAPAWNGLTYDPADVSDTGTPVLRSGNIQNGELDLQNLVRVDCSIPEKSFARSGDILICSRNGSRNLIGKNTLIHEDGYAFGAFMMIARPKVNSQYFYYLLNSGIFDFYLPTYLTSTVNQLTGTNFGNMIVPITDDPYEQLAIVEELNAKCKALDVAVEKKRMQLSLLRKQRESLIFEYVTGKRCVSEVA